MDVSKDDLLRRRTTSHAVAAQLREEIQSGALRPGARLPQEKVAERFGVSTTPVREALALLQAQGLVRVDPHKGAIVSHPTIEDLRHLYEIREALEVLSVEKAIQNLTEQRIAGLQRIIDRMRRTRDEQEWLRLNNDFHNHLYGVAGRPLLEAMIANLRDSASPYIFMLLGHAPDHSRPDGEHQEILDACRDRDVDRATKAVAAHMRNTVDLVVTLLDE